MVAYNLSLENQGERIDVNNGLTESFFKRRGATGFGVAPTILTISKSATAGGRWRRSKRDVRDIDLPLTLLSEDQPMLQRMMDKLMRVLDDTYTTPMLVATFPDGSAWEIGVHYVSGLDAAHGEETDGITFSDYLMTLRAPKPYWVSRDSRAYRLGINDADSMRGLLRNTSLTKLQVAPSQVIGDFQVDNDGNVEAYPVWTVTGPGSEFTARRNDGKGFIYTQPIVAGETVTFDTLNKKVFSSIHGNVWDNLAPAPKLFSLPRGESRIEVELVNSTTSSLVDMYFRPRRELMV